MMIESDVHDYVHQLTINFFFFSQSTNQFSNTLEVLEMRISRIFGLV